MKDPVKFYEFSDSTSITWVPTRSIKGGCHMTRGAAGTDGASLRSPEEPSGKYGITGLRIVRNR